ncbi:MAG TPA: hypothetical protein VKC66_18745 [Xanthobacteraceae bacterium]|nr:hypothetical protein [Xanthobacteraceae bacterium]
MSAITTAPEFGTSVQSMSAWRSSAMPGVELTAKNSPSTFAEIVVPPAQGTQAKFGQDT